MVTPAIFPMAWFRKISRRASELWAEFYGDTVQVNAYHRQADPEVWISWKIFSPKNGELMRTGGTFY